MYENRYLKERLELIIKAKTDEEKSNIVDKIYEDGFEDGAKSEVEEKKCISKCLGAGISISRSYNEPGNRSFFRENVRGLVNETDLEVPHSELAMHAGAAGGKLLLWTIAKGGKSAEIVYEGREGCCGYAHGLPSEVMQPELRKMLREKFDINID